MSTGTAGEYVSVTATGGNTAFSTASDTASLVVTAVNDAPTFALGNGGKLLMPVGSSTDEGYSVIQQADGKLVVAGSSSNGSNNDFSLVRLNADGTLGHHSWQRRQAPMPVGLEH